MKENLHDLVDHLEQNKQQLKNLARNNEVKYYSKLIASETHNQAAKIKKEQVEREKHD